MLYLVFDAKQRKRHGNGTGKSAGSYGLRNMGRPQIQLLTFVSGPVSGPLLNRNRLTFNGTGSHLWRCEEFSGSRIGP